jgi:hypothetical protein
MSEVKKVTGDYTIDPTGSVNLNSNTTITGNLTVIGATTTVTTTDTNITDRVLLLNNGESGAGITGRYSGLEFDRGSSNDDTFKISTDGGSTYTNILTGVSAGLTEVVQDTSPQLGGDLDVSGFNITSATSNQDINIVPNGTGNVAIEGGLKLNDQASAPSSVSGSSILYAATAGGGGTGVFFVDGSTSNELVSKSKAILYGLIF